MSNAITKEKWKYIVITGVLIGLATNMRITGPLVGFMLFGYLLLKKQFKALPWLIPTAVIALLTTYATWPYIWETPIGTFIQVVRTMTDYPVTPKVLFMGEIFESNALPRRYLPTLLGITLTEPTWPLFFGGVVVAIIRFRKKHIEWQSLVTILFWFIFMLVYVIITRPATYDGYRHFLFILPPVFIFGGFALEELYTRIPVKWIHSLLILALLAPGIIANVQLHPYQYTYYNSFVGGTKNVGGTFETDYWLTCYKEVIEKFNAAIPKGATLIIHREPANAAYYVKEGIQVKEYKEKTSGDYLLIGSRLNDIKTKNPQYLPVFSVGREGAGFCVIKLVP